MEIVLVNTDSPAWHAGVKLGDILVSIEGRPVNNIGEYRQAIAACVQEGKRRVEFKL